MSCSIRHLLEFVNGCAGPGSGGANGAGDDDRRGSGVEIVNVGGSGPLRLRPRNVGRPVETGGPIVGKPEHRLFESAGGHVDLSRGDGVKGRTPVQDDSGNA